MGDRNRKIAGCVVTLACLLLSSNTAFAACEKWAAKIASVQGKVEAKRSKTTNWQIVKLNDSFCAGDQIRVSTNSRAAIVLTNETLLRLDQNSAIKLTAIKPKQTSIIDLFKGIGHFISRVPRSLKVETPTMNAAIEGTEFVVAIYGNETRLTVFEGTVLASNKSGKVKLTNGESVVASQNRAPVKRILAKPRDAVQWALYYPPILDPAIKRNDNMYRAATLLNKGRAKEASAILNKEPHSGISKALQSIIAVVNNEKENALKLAKEAVKTSPNQVATHIALSYAHQANFNLDAALIASQQATIKDSSSALAWARVAELQLSLGMLDDALDSAKLASDKNNKLSRTQSILGYAHLLQIDIEKAKQAFTKAIKLDQTDPLPRLGMGLAKIRDNELAEGRREIEIAASLDPNNAIVRSYLGKAYFEEKRSPLDFEQFDMSKELDPNDPTPWFYDAIAKQSENRPVEALDSLQKSIELNDNRAVYRSSLQLDQDEAARSISLAHTYNNLGLTQKALNEATKSLMFDPANSSAHRFFSDNNGARQRHEIARVSELLQSQLLQPVGNTTVQPHLSIAYINAPVWSGPAQTSFNEYSPLFVQNQTALKTAVFFGNNNTEGDELNISGLMDQFSWSLSQYSYNTDGFRKNSAVNNDLRNAFIHTKISNSLDIQIEHTNFSTVIGDQRLNFDPSFTSTDMRTLDDEITRIGGHIYPSQNHDIIFSYLENFRDVQTFRPTSPIGITIKTKEKGKDQQLQYLLSLDSYKLILGIGKNEVDSESTTTVSFLGTPISITNTKPENKQENAYVYNHFLFGSSSTITLGLSHDNVKSLSPFRDIKENSGKIGIFWDISENTRFRAAAFEGVKRHFVVNQTIEPTQIAGFNQFFDDPNGSTYDAYGVAFDYSSRSSSSLGIEAFQRDVKTPETTSPATFILTDQNETTHDIYFNTSISKHWQFNMNYIYEKYKTEKREPTELTTRSLPIGIKYFSPNGLYGTLTYTKVSQRSSFTTAPAFDKRSEKFEIIDLSIGYKLPKQLGNMSLQIHNITNKEFIYQDYNYISANDFYYNNLYTPERIVTGNIAINY
ncbi:MAG: FecR domain-containing protein [Gammaproteobacteria bacterium]|nr:FecR domain-containing protein [Gammaproteobacteria bacterium]